MSRLTVKKTYKLYIGGKFPRSESGRYYALEDGAGKLLANVCLASRKDLRDAVVAARKGLSAWAGATAYLRGQILYRAAEMLEGRRAQFAEELRQGGATPRGAEKEVEAAVDLLVYYAGWCDKFSQVASTVNPVASPHFNFSVPEPVGVVGVLAPEDSGLLGLVGSFAPILAGGNAVVALASKRQALPAITLAEVLNDSDLPGGTVNLLTGDRAELLEPFSTHMDIRGLAAYGLSPDERKLVEENAALNVRRVACYARVAEDFYRIVDFVETKTTWHPVQTGSGGGGGY